MKVKPSSAIQRKSNEKLLAVLLKYIKYQMSEYYKNSKREISLPQEPK